MRQLAFKIYKKKFIINSPNRFKIYKTSLNKIDKQKINKKPQ